MGFGSFLKKFARVSASVAMTTAVDAAQGGLGGVAIGAIKLATNRDDRIKQISGILENAAGQNRVKAIAELIDDVASLSKLVDAARKDGTATPEEMNSIYEEVTTLQEDSKEALKGLH